MRVLAGHMECEPGAQKKQWVAVQEALAQKSPLPLISLMDHNSVMVPGQDSDDVPKELPETVKAREKEAVVLTDQGLEDVWPYLHGEIDEIKGYTFPSLSRRIDRIHLSSELLPTVGVYGGSE